MIGIFGLLLFVIGLRRYVDVLDHGRLENYERAMAEMIAGFTVFWIWLTWGGRP